MLITMGLLAMNAERQFKIVNKKTNNSLDKLSSGYRINRASDDAAGLSISEKMRSQIRGLTQGTRNIEDGISLCQTADGALEEVSSLLQRVRQLSVQSANDTNTAEDREAIQEEVDQLLYEIDRIGGCTEFNTRKIFCGKSQQAYRRRKSTEEIKYREVVERRQEQVEHTDALRFSVSGRSSEDEEKTYTIGRTTSANAGIVIGSDVIAWDNVKDQNGDSIELGEEIRAGRYSFEYKGMSVSVAVDENITTDKFLSEIKGVNWSTKQQYDGKMHYTLSAETEERYIAAYITYNIEATESGLKVNGNVYDWPSIVSSGNSNGNQSFSVQAGPLKVTLTTEGDNTVSYEDIFANIGTKTIIETSRSTIRQIFKEAEINGNVANKGYLSSYYTGSELYEMKVTQSRGGADQEGMWLIMGNMTTEKKSWDELYSAATVEGSCTKLVYNFGEEVLEFKVLDTSTREELIRAISQMPITYTYKPIVFHNAISNTLADIYLEDGSFSDLYLNNKLTQDEYEKALIANQFSFSSIGDGTPAKIVDKNLLVRRYSGTPTIMSNPQKEHRTDGFEKSIFGNLLTIRGYGASTYELQNKEELIEYFQNRTVGGGNSGGSSIDLFFVKGESKVSIKMLDTLERECDLETFLDAITAKSAYYNEYLVAPIFTQTLDDVEYYVHMSATSVSTVIDYVTQYKDTVDSANKEIYAYWADEIEKSPEYVLIEDITRIPIDENGEDIIEADYDEPLSLWIQCGANTAQGFMLEIDAMNTSVLGIDELDISTREGADVGITMADLALEKVMRNRSKIGVQQNRLEHAYDGERNAIENTQAAESRIRDIDMAKEAVVFAIQRILGEAGLAMISHANQDMRGVLLLLQ